MSLLLNLRPMQALWAATLAVGALLVLTGCETMSPAHQAQADRIAAEPRGDHWIGRRFHWEGTRVWGYVRRPGRPWKTARLVIMDEMVVRQPDRLPEAPETGLAHGYDHNYEYRVWGSLTDKAAYDPNGNMFLPLFRATRFERINRAPGFLFQPGDIHNQRRLPRYP